MNNYLENLPPSTLSNIYQVPSSILAILKLQSPPTSHLVFRLLYNSNAAGTHKSIIEGWFKSTAHRLVVETLRSLCKLHILSLNQASQTYTLNASVKKGLHNCLIGGGTFGITPEVPDSNKPSLALLEKHAVQNWESVLYFLVGTATKTERPDAIVRLLTSSGLMTKSGKDLSITSKGFQFLLQNRQDQIWLLLVQYLELSEDLNLDAVDMINFIFQLGSMRFGQDYSVAPLTITQKKMLNDFNYLGLVYQRNKKSSRFYLTSFSTEIASSVLNRPAPSSLVGESAQLAGFIMIETNFRVYAYTSSTLQIATLSLFISLQTRFANMVVGLMTRDSIREAFARDISADQIIFYLTSNAHPEMKRCTPALPSTVIDQIRLWEMERNRLRESKGVLYQQFAREQDFREALEYAKGYDYVLWHSAEKRMFVAKLEGIEVLRSYFSAQR